MPIKQKLLNVAGAGGFYRRQVVLCRALQNATGLTGITSVSECCQVLSLTSTHSEPGRILLPARVALHLGIPIKKTVSWEELHTYVAKHTTTKYNFNSVYRRQLRDPYRPTWRHKKTSVAPLGPGFRLLFRAITSATAERDLERTTKNRPCADESLSSAGIPSTLSIDHVDLTLNEPANVDTINTPDITNNAADPFIGAYQTDSITSAANDFTPSAPFEDLDLPLDVTQLTEQDILLEDLDIPIDAAGDIEQNTATEAPENNIDSANHEIEINLATNSEADIPYTPDDFKPDDIEVITIEDSDGTTSPAGTENDSGIEVDVDEDTLPYHDSAFFQSKE